MTKRQYRLARLISGYLETPQAAIRALDGNNGVAELLRCDQRVPANWSKRGYIPAQYHDYLGQILRRKGYDFPPTLFNQFMPDSDP